MTQFSGLYAFRLILSHFQIANLGFVDFKALDPKFHLALDPKLLKLVGSFFEILFTLV